LIAIVVVLQGVRKKSTSFNEFLVGITLKIQLKEVAFLRTPCNLGTE